MRPARGDQPRRRLNLLGRRLPRPSARATPAAGCRPETSGPAAAVRSRAASASYGAKNAFGRTSVPALDGVGLGRRHAGDRDVVRRGRAVERRVDRLELAAERRVEREARAASSRRCSALASVAPTMSTARRCGRCSRIVQPSAVRVTAICSVPTGAPRTNISEASTVPEPLQRSGRAACWATRRATRSRPARARRGYNGSSIHMASQLYQAATRAAAAFVDRSDRGRIVVSGERSRVVPAGPADQRHRRAEAGQGCYAAYLTAQGRMIADLWRLRARRRDPADAAGDVKDTVLAKLDQFIFSEDVQLGDVTDDVRADRGRRS